MAVLWGYQSLGHNYSQQLTCCSHTGEVSAAALTAAALKAPDAESQRLQTAWTVCGCALLWQMQDGQLAAPSNLPAPAVLRMVYRHRSGRHHMPVSRRDAQQPTCCSWLERLPARWPIHLCQGRLQGGLCQQLRGPDAGHLCQHGRCGIDLYQEVQPSAPAVGSMPNRCRRFEDSDS